MAPRANPSASSQVKAKIGKAKEKTGFQKALPYLGAAAGIALIGAAAYGIHKYNSSEASKARAQKLFPSARPDNSARSKGRPNEILMQSLESVGYGRPSGSVTNNRNTQNSVMSNPSSRSNIKNINLALKERSRDLYARS